MTKNHKSKLHSQILLNFAKRWSFAKTSEEPTGLKPSVPEPSAADLVDVFAGGRHQHYVGASVTGTTALGFSSQGTAPIATGVELGVKSSSLCPTLISRNIEKAQ